jgi:hypothetical protein
LITPNEEMLQGKIQMCEWNQQRKAWIGSSHWQHLP